MYIPCVYFRDNVNTLWWKTSTQLGFFDVEWWNHMVYWGYIGDMMGYDGDMTNIMMGLLVLYDYNNHNIGKYDGIWLTTTISNLLHWSGWDNDLTWRLHWNDGECMPHVTTPCRAELSGLWMMIIYPEYWYEGDLLYETLQTCSDI